MRPGAKRGKMGDRGRIKARESRFWGLLAGLFILAFQVEGETKTVITGVVDWTRMEIRASVSLDLKAAGIRIPSGRTLGEELLREEYPRLIRPGILSLPVDSSSTLGDLVSRGEFSLSRADAITAAARSVPPALSPDLAALSANYVVNLVRLSVALIRHRQAGEIPRALLPVPSAAHTGIVIVAYEELPLYGRHSSALLEPCVFPKIWDSEMNLIYERNLMDPVLAAERPLVRYVSPESIFQPSPSGLDPALAELVGENPLRIIARGVFGVWPTDPVIDREDALLIISSEENRRLLREGRVAIVLHSSTLRATLGGD
jgi:hypothetical protein